MSRVTTDVAPCKKRNLQYDILWTPYRHTHINESLLILINSCLNLSVAYYLHYCLPSYILWSHPTCRCYSNHLTLYIGPHLCPSWSLPPVTNRSEYFTEFLLIGNECYVRKGGGHKSHSLVDRCHRNFMITNLGEPFVMWPSDHITVDNSPRWLVHVLFYLRLLIPAPPSVSA